MKAKRVTEKYLSSQKDIQAVYGGDRCLGVFSCEGFPMRVSIVDGPAMPLESITANYLTCIEGKMWTPNDVMKVKSPSEIHKTVGWVLKGGHTPALECISFTFSVENASVVLLKQISRHRVGNSLGVMTQRANAEEWLGRMYENGHYVIPPSIAAMPEMVEVYKDLVQKSETFYNFAVQKGVQQDEARYGIIQGVTTMWQGTYSYKCILDNICSTRLCHLMQGEAVALASLMRAAVLEYCPMLGDAIKPICMKIGKCNRNENNPTDASPKGACEYTKMGLIPVRERDSTFDLTRYSKDANR